MGTQIEGFFKLQLWGHGNGSVLVLWDLVAFGVMSCAAGQVSVPAPRLWSLLSARWAFPTAGRRSQVLNSHADTHRLPERGMQCRVTPPRRPLAQPGSKAGAGHIPEQKPRPISTNFFPPDASPSLSQFISSREKKNNPHLCLLPTGPGQDLSFSAYRGASAVVPSAS